MNHLNVVAGTVFADVSGAGNAAFDGFSWGGPHDGFAGLLIDLGGDCGPDRLEFFPGGFLAAGHEGRAEAGAFFTAGHAGANEAETFFLERFFAADRVSPEGVAAVDDDVVRREQRDEAVDDGVGGFARLNQNHDLARERERLDEF